MNGRSIKVMYAMMTNKGKTYKELSYSLYKKKGFKLVINLKKIYSALDTVNSIPRVHNEFSRK